MKNLRFRSVLIFFSIIVFYFFRFAFAGSVEIELRISRNDILNPGSKNDLWLHIISHAREDIRTFTFPNASPLAIYLVDSAGLTIPHRMFSPPSRENFVSDRRPFHISPGDSSGSIVDAKSFQITASGIYYMIFAIPNPGQKGLIFSLPCKLTITGDRVIEYLETISFADLPGPIKNTFHEEFARFIEQVRFPLASDTLPF